MRRIKFSKKWSIIAVIVIVILVAVVYSISKNDGEKFVTEKVARGTVVQEVSETGTVKASEETNLSFRYAGRISQIYVEAGDAVTSGQLLAKLDTTELSIQLVEAKAALEVTEAKKTDAQVSLENARQTLKDVKADAEEDLKNAYEDALTALDDAYLKLYNAYHVVFDIQRDYFNSSDQQGLLVVENKNVIKDGLDNIKPYIDNAKAGSRDDIDEALSQTKIALGRAKDSLEIIRNTAETIPYRDVVSSANKTLLDNQKSYINDVYIDVVNEQQTISTTKITNETNINSAQATIDGLETQLASGGLYQAQLNQSKASISLLESKIQEAYLRSPASGQITKIEKNRGETVQSAETVISFLPSAPFKVEVDIYEEDVVNVKVGNPVKINIVAFPDETLEGSVVSIDPSEKLIDGVVYYEVNIDFKDVEEGTKIGMTADIVIETNRKENVLIVSRSAVKKIEGKRIVQVIKGDKAEEREIKVGLEGSDFVEVISGLEEGEEVVIR